MKISQTNIRYVNTYARLCVEKHLTKAELYMEWDSRFTLSDPRAVIIKEYVEKLAEEKHEKDEFKLYELIERVAPEVIAEERKIYKGVCINIDYYCGLLYKMLKIPYALYTPLFAIGRVVGWSAHRMEELINSYKIMRPAYPSLVEPKEYVPIDKR